ncbi:MAG: hypothetical protein ACRCSF_06810 [Mycobacteriaceae bacterium]
MKNITICSEGVNRSLAALLATFALLAGLTVVVLGSGSASAETPEERCARETATYNNTWENTWRATHPGDVSDPPPPPVPYICGQTSPTTTSATSAPVVTTTAVPTTSRNPLAPPSGSGATSATLTAPPLQSFTLPGGETPTVTATQSTVEQKLTSTTSAPVASSENVEYPLHKDSNNINKSGPSQIIVDRCDTHWYQNADCDESSLPETGGIIVQANAWQPLFRDSGGNSNIVTSAKVFDKNTGVPVTAKYVKDKTTMTTTGFGSISFSISGKKEFEINGSIVSGERHVELTMNDNWIADLALSIHVPFSVVSMELVCDASASYLGSSANASAST